VGRELTYCRAGAAVSGCGNLTALASTGPMKADARRPAGGLRDVRFGREVEPIARADYARAVAVVSVPMTVNDVALCIQYG